MTNFKITGILADVTAFLTIVAALPYELGPVADILPPEWKKYVATAGALATLILRIIKRGQQQAAAAALEVTAAGLAATATELVATNAAAAKTPMPVIVENPPSHPANTRETT